MTVEIPPAAAPVKKKRPLPFDIQPSSVLTSSTVSGLQNDDDGDCMDFFSRRRDGPLLAIKEQRKHKQREKRRTATSERHRSDEQETKRKRPYQDHNSGNNGTPRTRSSGSPTKSSRSGSFAKATRTSPVLYSDNEVIQDMKGKGKETIGDTRTSSGRIETSEKAARSSGTCGLTHSRSDSNVRSPSRGKPPRLKPPTSRRSRSQSRNATMEIADDEEEADKAALSDSPEPERPEPIDEEAQRWIDAAKERQKRQSDAPITIFLTSHVPGAKAYQVKRKVSQNMDVVLKHWIQTQFPHEPGSKFFLTWKGNKIYTSTTAALLGVEVDDSGLLKGNHWSDSPGFYNGGLHLEVWTDELYREWRETKEKERQRQLSLDDDFDLGSHDLVEERPVEKRRKIKVVLKAKTFEPLNISVHDDTTVLCLVQAFRKSRPVGSGEKVAIYFDGERLGEDSLIVEIDDIDPDDTNQMEVHITGGAAGGRAG